MKFYLTNKEALDLLLYINATGPGNVQLIQDKLMSHFDDLFEQDKLERFESWAKGVNDKIEEQQCPEEETKSRAQDVSTEVLDIGSNLQHNDWFVGIRRTENNQILIRTKRISDDVIDEISNVVGDRIVRVAICDRDCKWIAAETVVDNIKLHNAKIISELFYQMLEWLHKNDSCINDDDHMSFYFNDQYFDVNNESDLSANNVRHRVRIVNRHAVRSTRLEESSNCWLIDGEQKLDKDSFLKLLKRL